MNTSVDNGRRHFRVTVDFWIEEVADDEDQADAALEPTDEQPRSNRGYQAPPDLFSDIDRKVTEPTLRRVAREFLVAVAQRVPGEVSAHRLMNDSILIKVDGQSVCHLSPSRYHLRVVPIGHDSRKGDLVKSPADFGPPVSKILNRLHRADE